MTDPKGTWSDGGKVWEGEPQALAATRNVLAMTTDENLHATPAVGILSREKSDRILSECGYGPAGGQDGLRDCLQSIADISEEEPREPDDADWRFRCLEAIRAAKTTLAATPAVGGEMVLHPLSEIREWDEALAELGIQDSTTTPAEAVRALNAELEELRAALPASPLPAVGGEPLDAAIHLINLLRSDDRDSVALHFAEQDFETVLEKLSAAQPASPLRGRQYSENERHAIAHAKYLCDQASPSEDPEVCFDFELVRTLLSLIPAAPPEQPAAVTGRVTGTEYEGNQVRGMPGAICHACGLKDYPCVNPDCPNRPSEPEQPAADPDKEGK